MGVPLWVTELTADSDDENAKADYYERALRAVYGHPAVEGIMFWGFPTGSDMQVRNSRNTDPNLQVRNFRNIDPNLQVMGFFVGA